MVLVSSNSSRINRAVSYAPLSITRRTLNSFDTEGPQVVLIMIPRVKGYIAPMRLVCTGEVWLQYVEEEEEVVVVV